MYILLSTFFVNFTITSYSKCCSIRNIVDEYSFIDTNSMQAFFLVGLDSMRSQDCLLLHKSKFSKRTACIMASDQ